MLRRLVSASVLALSATGAWADRYEDCKQSADLDRQIRGCTQIVDRGKRESQKNRAGAYWNRGNAYYLKREVDRAIADFDKAIALNPEYVDAYVNRGNVYRRKGDFDRAIADHTKAIALNPNVAEAYYNRGLAYARKGEVDHAIVDYDKAIALNPKDAAAYNNRGNAYKNKDDLDRAVADYDKAIKLNPKLALAYYNRGLAYEQKAQGFQLPDSYSGATDRLGRFTEGFLLRRLQGDKEQAVADFRKALEINPSDQDAKDNLKALGVTP